MAPGPEGETGADHEARAKERYYATDYAAAMQHYEQAFAAYRAEGNSLAAARAARTVGWFRGWYYGEWAVCNGWMSRASNVFDDAEPGSNEHGWLLLSEGMQGNNLEEQKALYDAAIATARRHGDHELEAETLSRVGVMLVLSGHGDQGMPYLDQALTTLCFSDIEDISIIEGVFCGLFSTCERTYDVSRAEEWLRAADDLVKRRNCVAVGGYCRAHYAGILTQAGRWTEAEAELSAAAQAFSEEHVRVRANLLCRLAELRLHQGRWEEAGQLLAGLEHHEDAARPLAALYLARGDTALALDLLERTIADRDWPDFVELPLQALLVDTHLASGNVQRARNASERLSALAAGHPGPSVKAMAAVASGKVCLAVGEGDARSCLHSAISLFAQAQLPLELARTRLELARALSVDRREVAIAEATTALTAFEELPAARDADEAAALLRSLGAPARPTGKGRDGLTAREVEVLDLFGHGLTNAQIGERLFISPKTVEHHVGRILSKLGLRSRAEAAAYAVRSPHEESIEQRTIP